MAHSHKSESKSSRSGKLRSIGMGGGQGRSGRDNAAAFDGGQTMSSADQAPAGLMPTSAGTDSSTAGMYARGGRAKARKVVGGIVATKRMDRVARKSGGRVCKAEGGPADLGSGGSDKKSQAQRKADAPLKPKKPQELDTGSMPLFGDSAKQGSLFKRGGKVKDTDRDGRARGGKVKTDDYTASKTPAARAALGETNLARRYKRAFGGALPAQAAPQAVAATAQRPAMPAQAQARPGRATGGAVKKKMGGSTVNVIIAPQGAGGAGAGAGAPPPPPVVPGPAPAAPPPGAAPGGPPGAPPPMGGAPGMAPPPGGAPAFASGGAVSPQGQAGQHSGVGRMNQAAFYARQG